jgi:hypothetical protein
MRFLEGNEIAEWCSDRGVAVDPAQLPQLGPARVVRRTTYAEGRRSGRERAVATQSVEELRAWAECLLIVSQWGIWASGEDWPAYYAARAEHDERRSIDVAPGHLFTSTEQQELIRFLTMVMENGWDAQILTANSTSVGPLSIFVSHDEWVELREATSPKA